MNEKTRELCHRYIVARRRHGIVRDEWLKLEHDGQPEEVGGRNMMEHPGWHDFVLAPACRKADIYRRAHLCARRDFDNHLISLRT